jgi:cellulose synthase (UDP-forming)
VVGALLRPASGGFNVTAKGGVIERSYFDWGISRPYLFLLAGNIAGLVIGMTDFITGAEKDYPTLFFNMFWILYNVLILCASLAVASETRQIRANPRVAAWLPASLKLNNGKVIACHTDDFSAQGLGLSIPANLVLEKDTRISVSLYRGDDEAAFPAVVTFCGRGRLGVRFEGLTLAQETELTGMTFSRADAWISTWGQKQEDKPLTAFKLIVTIGRRGFKQLLRNIFHTVFPPRADKAP